MSATNSPKDIKEYTLDDMWYKSDSYYVVEKTPFRQATAQKMRKWISKILRVHTEIPNPEPNTTREALTKWKWNGDQLIQVFMKRHRLSIEGMLREVDVEPTVAQLLAKQIRMQMYLMRDGAVEDAALRGKVRLRMQDAWRDIQNAWDDKKDAQKIVKQNEAKKIAEATGARKVVKQNEAKKEHTWKLKTD